MVVVNLGDLVLGHVLNVVVVLEKSISLDTLVEGGLKSGGKNDGVFFIEENEDSVLAALLLGVLPVSVVALSTRSEFGDLKLAPVAQAVFVTPETLSIDSFLASELAPLFSGFQLACSDFLLRLRIK